METTIAASGGRFALPARRAQRGREAAPGGRRAIPDPYPSPIIALPEDLRKPA